jgi:uncharacterized protein YabE (DUF348 family)
VGAVVVGTAGFVNADKVVTLSVDGEVRQVGTYASTVADLLAEEGIPIGPHDALVPAVTATINEGSRVDIRRGRLVVLDVDGSPREIWTTATTVDELASSLGSRYAAATLTASRSERIPLTGFTVGVRVPKSVTLEYDGTSTELETTATTIGAVLREAGLEISDADLLSADLSLAPVDGLTVTVVRVTTDRAVSRASIPFRTMKKADRSLYRGVTKVVRAGKPGRRETTYVLTLHDGAVVSKERVAVETVRPPVTRVVVFGTRARPTAPTPRSSSGGGVDALNWAALARCESSGNPRAVGGGGLYFGLYQFTLGTWRGVGGKGNPIDASPGEQTYRAKLLYRNRGASPWPVCGRLLFS